jgi:hypothetical protein
MGYFSNGTEGMDYEAQYCDKCVHQDGPTENGCAVACHQAITRMQQPKEILTF